MLWQEGGSVTSTTMGPGKAHEEQGISMVDSRVRCNQDTGKRLGLDHNVEGTSRERPEMHVQASPPRRVSVPIADKGRGR